jgi:hypothetical protein
MFYTYLSCIYFKFWITKSKIDFENMGNFVYRFRQAADEVLMRKVLWLEAWLVITAEDYAILHGAVRIGERNDVCRIQVEG